MVVREIGGYVGGRWVAKLLGRWVAIVVREMGGYICTAICVF